MTDSDARIPIIRVWDVLLVPLQGDVTDQQVAALSQAVLLAIQAKGAGGLVLDLSGLLIVDSHLCASFASLGGAAALMGVRTVLCGMSPDIAFTLQLMGIELEQLHTALSLEDAFRFLGLEPQRRVGGQGDRAASTALANAMLERNPLGEAVTTPSKAGA